MDNKIFIIILTLIFVYFVFFRYKEGMTSCENLDFNPSSNPITLKMNQLLLENKLSTRSIIRLVNFDSRDFNEDNQLSLKQLFEKDKIPVNLQNSLLVNLNNLLNSYQLFDISKDYKLSLDNKVSTVKHLFLKNMVINHLICLNPTDIPAFWGLLVDMITTPSGIKCNDSDFIKFLHLKNKNMETFLSLNSPNDIIIEFNQNNNPIKVSGTINTNQQNDSSKSITTENIQTTETASSKFYEELKKIKVNDEENGEFIISFSKHFLNFSPEINGGKYTEEMDVIFDKFVKKNNRSINHQSEEDMKELMNIFQKELENLIEVIKKSKYDIKLENKYRNFEEIYHILRHNLLLTRVQAYLNKNNASESAYRCLSTNNKTCVNDINKIFGDKDIGFVKESGCLEQDTNRFGEASLDQVFSNHQFWRQASQEKKTEIFSKLKIMLEYHNVKIPDNFGQLKIKDLGINLESMRDLWLSKNIDYQDNQLYLEINRISNNINNLLKDSNHEKLFLEIVSKMNHSQKHMWNNLIKTNKLPISSNLFRFLIFGLELEKVLKNKSVEMFVNFGIPSDKTFYEIMIQYQIPIKMTQYLFDKISVYIPEIYGKSINSKVNQLLYQDNKFEKESYYNSYQASICFNKDSVLKRMETDFGESLSLENYNKIKNFLDKQC